MRINGVVAQGGNSHVVRTWLGRLNSSRGF